MRVILLEDVKKQGKKNDVIEVSDGYAENFLIKNNLAVKYTEASKNKLEGILKKQDDLKQEEINEAKRLKKEIEKINLTLFVKAGKEGKLFGTVTTKQISEELKKQNIEIDRKLIKIPVTIDVIGVHNVEINLHKDIKALLKINVKEE